MKKQDREESATQGSGDAPPTAGGTESPAAAKDSSDSSSLKEPEVQTPQSDTPPQSTEAESEGKLFPKHLMMFNSSGSLLITYGGISAVYCMP